MPMDFPDMKSLERCAECHLFRKPNKGETEDEFRTALADHVEPQDYIESLEIRNKVGWDKFSDAQNRDMLIRKGLLRVVPTLPLTCGERKETMPDPKQVESSSPAVDCPRCGSHRVEQLGLTLWRCNSCVKWFIAVPANTQPPQNINNASLDAGREG